MPGSKDEISRGEAGIGPVVPIEDRLMRVLNMMNSDFYHARANGLHQLRFQYSRISCTQTSNEISKFSKNVASHFDHVFVTSRGLKGFEDSFRSITCK